MQYLNIKASKSIFTNLKKQNSELVNMSYLNKLDARYKCTWKLLEDQIDALDC